MSVACACHFFNQLIDCRACAIQYWVAATKQLQLAVLKGKSQNKCKKVTKQFSCVRLRHLLNRFFDENQGESEIKAKFSQIFAVLIQFLSLIQIPKRPPVQKSPARIYVLFDANFKKRSNFVEQSPIHSFTIK